MIFVFFVWTDVETDGHTYTAMAYNVPMCR